MELDRQSSTGQTDKPQRLPLLRQGDPELLALWRRIEGEQFYGTSRLADIYGRFREVPIVQKQRVRVGLLPP